jgi:hypothetical protein
MPTPEPDEPEDLLDELELDIPAEPPTRLLIKDRHPVEDVDDSFDEDAGVVALWFTVDGGGGPGIWLEPGDRLSTQAGGPWAIESKHIAITTAMPI